MAELRGKPPFRWPVGLATRDPERYPSACRWHLDRATYAASVDRKDLVMREIIRGTPSLRHGGTDGAGPVVIVQPPK
jgi:hypothetical protein